MPQPYIPRYLLKPAMKFSVSTFRDAGPQIIEHLFSLYNLNWRIAWKIVYEKQIIKL